MGLHSETKAMAANFDMALVHVLIVTCMCVSDLWECKLF